MINIRRIINDDHDSLWNLMQPVIAAGDSYVFDPNSTKEKILSYWLAPNHNCYVAVSNDEIVGTYILKQNQPDLGSHIANSSYMVHPDHQGEGIGRQMAEHSMEEAKAQGYHAMQFNIVVKSNEGAIRLWKKLGFEIIGEIPEAFNHSKLGLTNAYVMYRKL